MRRWKHFWFKLHNIREVQQLEFLVHEVYKRRKQDFLYFYLPLAAWFRNPYIPQPRRWVWNNWVLPYILRYQEQAERAAYIAYAQSLVAKWKTPEGWFSF